MLLCETLMYGHATHFIFYKENWPKHPALPGLFLLFFVPPTPTLITIFLPRPLDSFFNQKMKTVLQLQTISQLVTKFCFKRWERGVECFLKCLVYSDNPLLSFSLLRCTKLGSNCFMLFRRKRRNKD